MPGGLSLLASLVVYINGGGGHFVASAHDDASQLESNVVKYGGQSSADIPAFEGAPGEWKQMMACVRHYYAGLPVEIVDERPAGDDYLMLVVGGRSTDVGYRKLWGLSSTKPPRVVERGVGFVFSAAHPASSARVQHLCETTAHEMGHLLGLKHTAACDDLMTSNTTCVRQAPIYGFRADNWSVLARSVEQWSEKRDHGPEKQPVSRTARPSSPP